MIYHQVRIKSMKMILYVGQEQQAHAERIDKHIFTALNSKEADVHGKLNQQPRRKRRGTVLNVSHCVFYKVVAVGFNTLCYDSERSSNLYIRV